MTKNEIINRCLNALNSKIKKHCSFPIFFKEDIMEERFQKLLIEKLAQELSQEIKK